MPNEKPQDEAPISSETKLPNLFSDDLAKEWLKEEQKQRRQEIENQIQRIETDQSNALFAVGAYWAFIITNYTNIYTSKYFVMIIPVGLLVFEKQKIV